MSDMAVLCKALSEFDKGNEDEALRLFRLTSFYADEGVRGVSRWRKSDVFAVKDRYVVSSPYGRFLLCGKRVRSKRGLPVLPLRSLRKMTIAFGFGAESNARRRQYTEPKRRAVRRTKRRKGR